MKPLQGGIEIEQLRNDPDFNAMAPEIQVQYLSEEFLPKTDPTFGQLPAGMKGRYIQEEIMPNLKPVNVSGVGDTGFGQDLRSTFSPMDNALSTMRASQANYTNQHPLLSGATDVLSGRALARGALQGLSAGGYTPGRGGTLPNQLADLALGMPSNNPVSNSVQYLGQMGGGFAGMAGLMPLLGPMGAGGLFFGTGDLNSQLDQGRSLENLNLPELAGQTALGAVGAKLPAALGGKLPVKMGTGALMGGVTNMSGHAINQATNGGLDFTDPTYWHTFLEGLGPGAAFGLAHRPGPPRQQRPVSVKGAHELQGRVEYRPPPWGLDPRGQQIAKNILTNRKGKYEQAKQRRAAQLEQRRQATALPVETQLVAKPEASGKTIQAEVNYRVLAEDLHRQLNSENAIERAEGQRIEADWKRFSKKLKYSEIPQDIKDAMAADPEQGQALKKAYTENVTRKYRELLAEVSIVKQQKRGGAEKSIKRPEPDKKRVDLIVKTGKVARQQGGERKARFDNYLERTFDKEARRVINERIGLDIKQSKKADTTLEGKVKKRTERRQAEVNKRRTDLAKKEQDAKKARIKAENQRLEAEVAKQAEEEKTGEIRKGMPKVIEPERIEQLADELFQHYQKGEKGSLDAKISKYRSTAKADFTKTKKGGVDKNRSDAINETHARVLDRYAQKLVEENINAPLRKKPENIVKARADNIKELEDNEKAGGSYDFKTGKGIQKPLKASQFEWKDVRDSVSDPELQTWGDTIDQAMREDAVVRVRYDAERVGDTGQFEYKELAPLDWGFNISRDADGKVIGTKVVFHAINKNGHTGEYYLEPSDVNAKSGTVSGVLDAPVLLTGKTAFRNTDPNVYQGPRAFKTSDILSRPARQLQGRTSETRAAALEAIETLRRWEGGEPVSAADINKAAKTATNLKATANKKQAAKADKPKSEKQKATENREAIQEILVTMKHHHDWGEQPASDFLNRYGIDHPKSKQGSVLHYRVWIPGKAWVAFKWNASINQLFGQTGIKAIAAKINQQKGGLESLQAELKELSYDSDIYEGEMHKLHEQGNQGGLDEYAAREAEENAYYERMEQGEKELTEALEKATTVDDLVKVFDRLGSDAYHDMPPEFFEGMIEVYNRHTERVENGENRSAQPERSVGDHQEKAGRSQGEGKTEKSGSGKNEETAGSKSVNDVKLHATAKTMIEASERSHAVRNVMENESLSVDDFVRLREEGKEAPNQKPLNEVTDC